jgi:hypothetical protein
MPATPLRNRVAPLLAWSSPVLVLVLLLGFHQRPTPSTSTTTTPPSERSSLALSLRNGQLRTPLANVLRGVVGPADRSVAVPLTSNRPWRLSLTPGTHAALRCGHTSRPVSLVVMAPTNSCLLELTSSAPNNQPWTLRLLP